MIKIINYLKERNKIRKEFEKDEEGRAIVNISIRDKEQVLSPFCYEEKETIKEEFAGLLDNIIKSVPPKQKVRLVISGEDIDNAEKESFALAIKNHYANKILDSQLRLKNAYMIFAICVVLSILSLGLLFLVNYLNAPYILIEVVDILAWVFVWEAADVLIFQRGLIQLEKSRYTALYKSKICYN